MRWRFPEIDDTIPSLDRCICGGRPKASYGPTSVISCQRCGEEITVETPAFFRDGGTQREHETWRAVLVWKDKRNDGRVAIDRNRAEGRRDN